MKAPSAANAPSANTQDEGHLPVWVLSCWPRSWRESYGEEMSLTWCDEGALRRQLPSLALQGLRQRVTRPVAAASLGTGGGRPGYDVAIVGHPRYLFRLLVTALVLVAIYGFDTGFVLLAESRFSSVAIDSASSSSENIRMAISAIVFVGLPLAVAAWGSVRLNDERHRDSACALILGGLGSIVLTLVVPFVFPTGLI